MLDELAVHVHNITVQIMSAGTKKDVEEQTYTALRHYLDVEDLSDYNFNVSYDIDYGMQLGGKLGFAGSATVSFYEPGGGHAPDDPS